ncbi:MAG: RidA family protein [Alphaproteobacteria bacterium]
MPNKPINPDAIVEPIAKAYSHAVLVPPGSQLLFISGQVGVRKDGSLPADITAQSEVVWENITAILKEAGMAITDLARMTAYVVGTENFPKYAAVRTRVLAGHRPASTTFFVPGLVRPEMLIEVEAVAAKAP